MAGLVPTRRSASWGTHGPMAAEIAAPSSATPTARCGNARSSWAARS
ncbi:hypothetical protein [[Actinomadura] parvosata]|nr:hypothetical protein [Nonomuraea sp. ATCC 55076]